MKRKILLAGNWKMHKKPSEVAEFFADYAKRTELLPGQAPKNIDLLFAVPYVCLPAAQEAAKTYGFDVAAQNIHQEAEGAFTGEISAPMLTDLGIRSSLVGHSERRQYFQETDDIIATKVKACLDFGLLPVLCVGETKEERQQGETEQVLKRQMDAVFSQIAEWENLVVAYEPVWAIGTGLTASPEQAQEAHQFIRGLIDVRYGAEPADQTRILYGGSVKPDNADSLFSQPDIDGGLVGGASLKVEDFASLTRTALAVSR